MRFPRDFDWTLPIKPTVTMASVSNPLPTITEEVRGNSLDFHCSDAPLTRFPPFRGVCGSGWCVFCVFCVRLSVAWLRAVQEVAALMEALAVTKRRPRPKRFDGNFTLLKTGANAHFCTH